MGSRARNLERFYPALVLALVFSIAWIASPPDRKTGASIFVTPENLLKLLRQVSEIGILAIGETLVILSAGIDLSIGSVLGASSMVSAYLLVDGAYSAPVAVAGGLATGLAFGMMNGMLVVWLRIQPFVATLATFGAARGVARLIKENASIGLDESQGGFLIIGRSFRETAAWIRSEEIPNSAAKALSDFATIPAAIFLSIGLISAFVLAKTRFGRTVYAIGGNAEASRLAGLPVRRNLLLIYAICGILAGLAGVIHCAQLEQANPVDGEGYELRAIAAVAIGGTLLTGGRGGVFSTMAGVLTLGCLSSILGIRNVRAETQLILIAIILILAVKLPEWILKLAQRTNRNT
ncbi:MAG: ABC transporter permease [Planctomycetes bacterium]|nr:ABC transporter permease [Planctomycetota bacterium]